MAAIPIPVTELLEQALVAELTVVVTRAASARHLPIDPAVGRAKDLPDVIDPVQPQAGAHRAQREGVSVDHRPDQRRRPDRSRHDPGRRPDHRRRSATAVGSGCCPSGRPRSPRSCCSSRLASPCHCSSNVRSSRSPRGRSTGPLAAHDTRPRSQTLPLHTHDNHRGGRVMRSEHPELDARAGLDRLAGYPHQIAPGGSTRLSRERRCRGGGRPGRPDRHLRDAGRPGHPDRSAGVHDGLPHPAAAGLRLRRASPRHGVGTSDRR